MPKYNVAKFEKLQNRAQQLHGAVKSANEEKQYWHGKLRAAEAEINNRKHMGEPKSETLEIQLKEAETKYQVALNEHLEAQQRWAEVGGIVNRCENFLIDHGFRVGDQSVRITS